jgi:hypothetical protein
MSAAEWMREGTRRPESRCTSSIAQPAPEPKGGKGVSWVDGLEVDCDV